MLGRVAQAVLAGFLAQTAEIRKPRLQALLHAFDDGHVLAWSADRRMQRGLALTTVGGAFDPSGTDAISVVTNSASGTKLDFYQQRTVSYDVRLARRGHGHRGALGRPAERLPDVGVPAVRDRSVQGTTRRSRARTWRSSTCTAIVGCALQSATRGGEPVELSHHQMDGYPVLRGLRADGIGRHGDHHGRARTDASVGGRRPGRHVPTELRRSDHDPARPRCG